MKLHILLNPGANRAAAGPAWPEVEASLRSAGHELRVLAVTTRSEAFACVGEAVGEGAETFVAAGGDGTLQLLVDALMISPSMRDRTSDSPNPGKIRVGAIGMGTSNDFHKPLDTAPRIAGFPCRLKEEGASPRDVIELSITRPDGMHEIRCFLQAAHVGTIAETNQLLTQRHGIFNNLYHFWYKPALLGASAYTVFTYPGFDAEVKCGKETWTGTFTGMSLIKQPYVAGDFKFATNRRPDDGLFDLALCCKVTPWRLIGLIDAFEKKGLSGHENVHFAEASEVSVRFAQPQPIDYDGELIMAIEARWRVIPKALTILG
ncbi:MAG: hypothetical protein HQM09_17890 [Candidatus Riflebacteria bacterium]|nr:hypothetical protein [Candidatus Riflebacteria bacterium]